MVEERFSEVLRKLLKAVDGMWSSIPKWRPEKVHKVILEDRTARLPKCTGQMKKVSDAKESKKETAHKIGKDGEWERL